MEKYDVEITLNTIQILLVKFLGEGPLSGHFPLLAEVSRLDSFVNWAEKDIWEIPTKDTSEKKHLFSKF